MQVPNIPNVYFSYPSSDGSALVEVRDSARDVVTSLCQDEFEHAQRPQSRAKSATGRRPSRSLPPSSLLSVTPSAALASRTGTRRSKRQRARARRRRTFL
eukprot:752938-Hanusia_phi.AAC.1